MVPEELSIPTVKHGKVMDLGSFTALGTGQLAVIDSPINSGSYQKLHEDNFICLKEDNEPDVDLLTA